MLVVHAYQDFPERFQSSVFLAGPTPRDSAVSSWRPQALQILSQLNYEGVVFVPEPADGRWKSDYVDQIEWEERARRMSDLIVVWCPRDLQALPGFTTNVEFGLDLHTGKIRYGRPPEAPHTRYLDWQYQNHTRREAASSLEQLLREAVDELGTGAERMGGQRNVPLAVWRTKYFQDWHTAQQSAGNRLDDANLLWQFTVPEVNLMLCCALWVKIWVAAENRHKENEFILTRSDLSCVIPYYKPEGGGLLDTQIVLIKEFRSTARTPDGFIHELPGGSNFKSEDAARKTALDELADETGIRVAPSRLRPIGERQFAGAFSTHKGHLFAVELTEVEIAQARQKEVDRQSFGLAQETERTYVEVRTVRQIVQEQEVDWATLGMLIQALMTDQPTVC